MDGASRCSSGRSGSIEFVRCGFVSFKASLRGGGEAYHVPYQYAYEDDTEEQSRLRKPDTLELALLFRRLRLKLAPFRIDFGQ